MTEREVAIIHVGYVANIPYFLCYALNCLGYVSYNAIPQSILLSKYARVFYGSMYNQNPLNVNIVEVKDSPHWLLFIQLSKLLAFLKKKYRTLIIHLHVGSALRDHIVLDLIAKLLNKRFKLFVHFHGTDVRTLSYVKARIFKAIYDVPFFVSTPDLLAYCKRLDMDCEWLNNPCDPLILRGQATKDVNSHCKILCPTRFDATKALDNFFNLFIRALRERPDLSKELQLFMIVWPNTADNIASLVKKLQKCVKVVLLPLQTRKCLIKLYQSVNVVVGQLLLGTLGLTELEALASQNHVIMGPLRPITRNAYRAIFKTQIPVIEISGMSDLIDFLSKLPLSLNFEGREFAIRVSEPVEIGKRLLKIYSEYVNI